MKKFWNLCVAVTLVALVGIFFQIPLTHAQASQTGSRSFAGVVWDKEGGILMIDQGIEYVAMKTFKCLSLEDYFEFNWKIDLNVDYIDFKHERADNKGFSILNRREISAREALAKMSSKERFRMAMTAAGIPENEQRNYILITERVIYPDTKSKGLTYWYTMVPASCWKCKEE